MSPLEPVRLLQAVTDCRGVTHITAQGRFGGGTLALEQVLSAED
jgi:hypothetical protein